MPRAVSTAAASKCWSRMTHRIRPRHGRLPRRSPRPASPPSSVPSPAPWRSLYSPRRLLQDYRRQPDGHHPALTGKDDLFLRVTEDTRGYSDLAANHHFRKTIPRRVAIVFDTRNRAYTEDWVQGFRLSRSLGSAARSLQKSCSSPATCRIIRRWFASCLPASRTGCVRIKRDRRRALAPGGPRCGRPANADRGRMGCHRAFHRTWRQGHRRCFT